MPAEWPVLEPDHATVMADYADPLQALAAGTIAGVVIRGAYNPAHCEALVARFVEQKLIPDPAEPAAIDPDQYQTVAHYRSNDTARRPLRIDIGTSLVNMTRLNAGSDDQAGNKAAFFAHAAATEQLFDELFDGFDNPVTCLYDNLAKLACGREVKTARERDGSRYGPAIFRVHYSSQTYTPHINHVRVFDKLNEFAVSRFEHQFAGLICFQNPASITQSPHATIHNCAWSPEVQAHLDAGTWREYASSKNISTARIVVEPGDFYLFNSGLIHEVGPVTGDRSRMVLATFIGYSPGDREVFVWS